MDPSPVRAAAAGVLVRVVHRVLFPRIVRGLLRLPTVRSLNRLRELRRDLALLVLFVTLKPILHDFDVIKVDVDVDSRVDLLRIHLALSRLAGPGLSL